MREIKNEYVILSAQLKGLTPSINERRHETLISVLDDLKVRYNVVNGFYDGFTETSVMITLETIKGFTEEFFAEIACKNFNQESILYIDKNNHARLIKTDVVEYLGEIVHLSSEAAKSSEAWTWIPETNKYIGVV